MVEATWVPCPLTSVTPSSGTKLSVSSICVDRSGWWTSMPVSSTATVTPAPSNPAAQASGAPICGTLSLRLASTRPSSHSLATPLRRVGVGSVRSSRGATEVQNVRTCGLAAVSDAPSMESSSRTSRLPRGATGVVTARVWARV